VPQDDQGTQDIKVLKMRMMRVLEIGNRPGAINCTTASGFFKTRNLTSISENGVTKPAPKHGGKATTRSARSTRCNRLEIRSRGPTEVVEPEDD